MRLPSATHRVSQIRLRYPLYDWRFLSSGNLPQTRFYDLTEDTVTINVESGSRLNLTSDEIEIVLNAPAEQERSLLRAQIKVR